MNVKTLKMKNLVMERYPIILISLILLFVGTFILGCFAYPTSITTDEEFVSSSYTQYGGYDHFAKVTEPNPIYATGTILGESYPAYFYAISPDATINFSCGFIPSDTSKMETTVETKIIASSNTRTKDEIPFWTKTYSVNEKSSTLNDDEVFNHVYVLDVQDIQRVIDDVKKQLKYSQSATVKIVTSVISKGIIDGEPVKTHKEYVLPVSIESSYYQLVSQPRTQENIKIYDSREVTIEPTAMEKISSFAIPWILLIITVAFYVYNKYHFVKTEEIVINLLQREKNIADLSDWISKGSLPKNYELIPSIKITLLTDLVKLSIDTTSRVIYDESKSIYFCMSNNIMYMFCQGESNMNGDQI